ncbi:hypothetical protein BT93_L3185 [Corymbia citriodora subsp. variegata]|uniref:non-specific serine/threonine protein kinase n=1 Tax=Corymbia citriodora subsp. variegata TaxID=360336 RepID=A0A8T0CJ10_CORYI|nr:hypothetical protein BT93_L3185 [Corymbia citriodora subsp. variegata]
MSSMPFPTLTFLLATIVAAQPQDDALYYDRCRPFTCGGINFSFPFSNFSTFGSGRLNCGLPRFQVNCDASDRPNLIGTPYQVRALSLDPNESVVTVVNDLLIKELKAGLCDSLQNLTVPSSEAKNDNLTFPQWLVKLTFFKCGNGIAPPREIFNGTAVNTTCGDEQLYLWMNRSSHPAVPSDYSYRGETPDACRLVEVPVSDVIRLRNYTFMNKSNDKRWSFVLDLMREGFPLVWSRIPECEDCKLGGGRCGVNAGLNEVVCLCDGGCKKPDKTNLIIGCALGSSSLVLVMALLFIFKKRIRSVRKTSRLGKDETAEERANAEQFIRKYQSTLLTKYSYKDIKKMTHTLKERLGEGGYGTVYKGKLPDGRPIAVKILDKSSNSSQDFINEVATIGTIHHVNIIRLLGFCLEGSKQALIYEFMPNGSLGDLLHKEESNLSLAMERLLEIAIGVALGIEYLHKGCASRILHLDIKPHNVLLDENFNPKISDFGLAKIYSRNRSFITMTGARGTIGFIAPEIFMRNLGNPSHKSDVYSFGMLLLEMVGGRKHEKVKGSESSESYFPGWIYDEINEERAQEFGDLVEEVAVSRKMAMVGLWCIQINPKERPSMTQVLEMLMGNSNSIPMPPKPQFFSPPHAQVVPGSSSTDVEAGVVPLTLDSQDM